jgi:molybdopterin molybdotransferase
MGSEKKLIELDDALNRMLASIAPLTQTELIPIQQAHGRVLAREVRSALNVPSFDNSAMDGYALRCMDVSEADIQNKKAFAVSQRIAAGDIGAAVQAGTLVRIFTGAPVPPGADAVIQQEHVTLQEGGLAVLDRLPRFGDNIRRAGEDIEAGAVVIEAGKRLSTVDIGVAASVGQAELEVFRRPKVALFVTGDELTEPGHPLKPGSIYNSNRYVLNDLLHQMGCDVSDLGILQDSLPVVQDALQQVAQEHDLILTSGGVSVGEEDHVKQAVTNLGRIELWKLAVKPGKPLAFGQVNWADEKGHAWFIGLPGNPVASFVTFLLAVRPFLQKLSGRPVSPRHAVQLQASFSVKTKERREFLRARMNDDGLVELYPNQSSGVLTSMAWAQGLVDIPARTEVHPGDQVSYIRLSELST